MTIAGILRRHGHDIPRYVGPNGRVTFHISPHTAASGLAIQPHTFHGGTEHEPDAGPAEQWWKNQETLKRDREAMKKFFPSFVELEASDSEAPGWYGKLDTGRGTFPILVRHRTDQTLPSVVPFAPSIRQRHQGKRTLKSPHLYLNGNLCVASAEDWDPNRDTIATVIAWAAHWHLCYGEWYVSGIWPTEGLDSVAA